jgi:hypothetical protein
MLYVVCGSHALCTMSCDVFGLWVEELAFKVWWVTVNIVKKQQLTFNIVVVQWASNSSL